MNGTGNRPLIDPDALLDCFWRLDLDWRIRYASPAAEAMFGIPAGALVGSPLSDHTTPGDFSRLREQLGHVLAGADRTQAMLFKTRIRHADGRLIPVEVHGRVELDAVGQPESIVGLARIVDARRGSREDSLHRMRTRMRQQKADAVASLAGGIVDDLDALVIALQSCPDSNDKPQLFALSQRASERVGQLRTLAGKLPLIRKDVVVDEVLPGILEGIRADLPSGQSLVHEPGIGSATVWVDPERLADVLRELCRNASAAMDHGGDITIRTGQRNPDAPVPGPPVAPLRPWATIEITDNGRGLDRVTSERMFDPFYTTSTGSSAGLGLALVRGIIDQHGGHIEVDSELGRGTTIRLLLRIGRGQTARDPSDRRGPDGIRVLLVDDDAEVRRYADRVLRSAGYQVVICDDGVDALAVVAGEDAFDVVVLDWALPGIDGRRVREQLRARCPSVPVLIISGHPRGEPEALGLIDSATPWLAKPFTPAALLDAVRTALTQADSPQGS